MTKSLSGHCLIASKQLRDPNFYKSAVLIIEHGSHGAMGLVINRPSSVLVQHALAQFFDLHSIQQPVYVGGPVEPRALLVLHNRSELAAPERPIVPGVYIGNSENAFKEVMRRASEGEQDLKFRIFSGCAGWAPDQLEGELARGDWHTAPACRDIVFHEDPYEVYDAVLKRVHEAHRVIPQSCPNPTWN
ncbi:MAG TPA: YqgE/AlgH family protein [Planctomycetaceae bacterium]|nr:YqgE/AlgH family protein [Planctomycetaceae bacterium]